VDTNSAREIVQYSVGDLVIVRKTYQRQKYVAMIIDRIGANYLIDVNCGLGGLIFRMFDASKTLMNYEWFVLSV
jgi:hypothetical protein